MGALPRSRAGRLGGASHGRSRLSTQKLTAILCITQLCVGAHQYRPASVAVAAGRARRQAAVGSGRVNRERRQRGGARPEEDSSERGERDVAGGNGAGCVFQDA